MASILVFLAALLIIATWWLSRQGLMSKPWLEQGAVGWPSGRSTPPAAAKAGLGVFLAVIGSLFALFISAYAMRMQMPDWRALPLPNILWLNTGMLVLSSIALHAAGKAARRAEEEEELKLCLLAAAVTALAFLSGQLLAWRQLTADGYLLTSNSANAFFYVLTGLHGLHLLGGLAALGRATARAWQGIAAERLRLSVELCATYWHFLLFVWLVLVSVLTGWAGDVIDICRQLLT